MSVLEGQARVDALTHAVHEILRMRSNDQDMVVG